MSIAAMTWARKQITGSATMKAVLTVVADYADERGISWPSQSRLAKDTELSIRSVRTALQSLEEKGFIRREAVTRDDGSRGADRIYLCHHSDISGGGETASGGVGKQLPGGGETASPLTTFEPPPEPLEEPEADLPAAASAPDRTRSRKSKINHRIEYDGDFEMLWVEYPKTNGSKTEAYRAWLRLPVEDRDPCFDGARIYVDDLQNEAKWAALKRQPPPFCHLATFINQRRFESLVEQE